MPTLFIINRIGIKKFQVKKKIPKFKDKNSNYKI